MLTASELAGIRQTATEFLPDTATILRRTLTADGNGGQQASYASVGTAACRLVFSGSKSEPTMKDRAEGGRIASQQNWILTLAYDADIEATDRFTVNDDTYEMITPTTVRSYEVSKRLLVKKL